MNTPEHAALSLGGGSPVGESWGAPSSLSLGGQGGGWASAAGGILHQVQRLTAHQAGVPVLGGGLSAQAGGAAGVNNGSAGTVVGPSTGIGFPGPVNAAAGTPAGTDFGLAGIPSFSAGVSGIPGIAGSVDSAGSSASSAVQRTRATWAGASTSLMSLSGQGHGLAAMTGGLAARAFGPAAVQRMSTTGVGSVAGSNVSPATGAFPNSPTTAAPTFGTNGFALTPTLQRLAAGESGSAALGAALLERMSGTGGTGWTSSPGNTLAGGAGSIAGIAGGMSARIQRMAESGSIGSNAGAASSIDVGSFPGSFGRESWGAGSQENGSANLGSSTGSYGTPIGINASGDSAGGGAFVGLPAVQRVDPATWTMGGSHALAGQGYGLAAMSGGLTARALQAGGSSLAAPVQRLGSGSDGSDRSVGSAELPLQRFATSAAIGQAAAGAAQRLASTAVLLGGGRAGGGDLAGGAPAVMVSRMWSGQAMGGAMTDDMSPGAAGPNGSPVPGLSEMTQRAQGTSAMLVFSGLTGDETAASNPRSGGAPALPVSRAMAMPPSTPAPAAAAGRVLVQRATPSLAPPVTSETTLAGRSLIVPSPPVQRAVSVDEISTESSSSSTSSSSDANPGTNLPQDMETLIDTVIKRLKRQWTLDHERAGGFRTSLLR